MTSKVLEHQDKAISTTVEDESKDSMWLDELTPRQIVTELDKYIVGQDDAKKSVAIVLRDRWRRQRQMCIRDRSWIRIRRASATVTTLLFVRLGSMS